MLELIFTSAYSVLVADNVGQLTSAVLKDTAGAILKGYSYAYDDAGNRTVEAIDTLVTGESPNNLNQLVSQQSGSGVLPIRGTTNEPASTVTVNGAPAVVKPDYTFEGKATVAAGDNTISVAATDVNGNTTTNQYNVSVTGSGSKALVYDPNGNLTSDGTKTYEWDALNRLTAINNGTLRSEFTYNGLNQRVKLVEKDNGTVTNTRNLVWVGSEICEARNANNTVSRRYYAQGMQMGTTNYYYTRDHLGSIRELTDSAGVVVTRYDYGPYGRRTKLTGNTTDADFGFTGLYHHKQSGLNLAQYRAYNADFGRWISRDPIGEQAGINLYGYCFNDPINFYDPYGLLRLWGNWGGPGWVSGQNRSEVDPIPNPGDPDYRPPRDKMDALFEKHDRDMNKAHNMKKCPDESDADLEARKQKAKEQGDKDLAQGLKNLPWYYHYFGPLAYPRGLAQAVFDFGPHAHGYK